MTPSRTTLLHTLTMEGFPRPEIARCLSPNASGSQCHWTKRHKARTSVLEDVWIDAHIQRLPKMRGLVTMQPILIYPVVRKRDDDNAATGVMKVVRDALVKGGWLEADDTDHLRQLPVEIRVEPKRRALVLEFWA